MEKSELVDHLWIAFLYRLCTEWDECYAASFGPLREHFAGLRERRDKANALSFHTAISAQAQIRMQAEQRAIDVPSYDTLLRWLQAERISPHTKNNSLDFLAWYAGYLNFTDFRLQLTEPAAAARRQTVHQALWAAPLSTPATSVPPEGPAPAPLPSGSKPVWWDRRPVKIVGGLLLILGLSLLFAQDRRRRHERVMSDLIFAAVPAEFQAYAAVPAIDDSYRSYYSKTSNNPGEIDRIVHGSILKNVHLDTSSGADVIITKLVEWQDDTAAVWTSRERWLLRWLHADSTLYKKYDVINDQLYRIIREDGTWKIETNAYTGRASTVEN